MVFMGTSLADGAWGRESAVFRVSGVLSVIGGWFFTALSAFVVAFVVANVFYFGGIIAIIVVLGLSFFFIAHSHLSSKRKSQVEEEDIRMDAEMEIDQLARLSAKIMRDRFTQVGELIMSSLDGLENEHRKHLKVNYRSFKREVAFTAVLRDVNSKLIESTPEKDVLKVHLLELLIEYLEEMHVNTLHILKGSYKHVDNHHRPVLEQQVVELKEVCTSMIQLLNATANAYESLDYNLAKEGMKAFDDFVDFVRSVRSSHLKRIANHKLSSKSARLYLSILKDLKMIALVSNRMLVICTDMVINKSESTESK